MTDPRDTKTLQEISSEVKSADPNLKIFRKHTLWESGDPDCPDSIKDRNGEVVLGLCKACGRVEEELEEECDKCAS